jgi:hypothetical protein
MVDQAADVLAVGVEADLEAGDVRTATNEVFRFGALDIFAKRAYSGLDLSVVLLGDGDLLAS